MTDNTKILPSVDPSAIVIATDDVAGVHYPVYKLAVGVDDEAVLVSTGDPLPVVDPFQRAIAQGKVFFGNQVLRGVANGGEEEWLVSVGANPVGVSFSAGMLGSFEIILYRETVTSADGTVQTNFNENQNDTVTTIETLVYYNPTVTVDGTQLTESLIEGGAKNSVLPASADGQMIFKSNTKYLLHLLNASGNVVDIEINWQLLE